MDARKQVLGADQSTPVLLLDRCGRWIVVAVSLGGGTILLIGEPDEIAGGWRSASRNDDLRPQRTQGLVQLRVVNLDEDVDVQETSCYVHEGPHV
ncbi:oxidoreductase domain-containing protein [Lasius niger]|uniref:Oxidoreductase domain-containing protein n=1 Tax=Lasius niger TaxID=67767 RepID=A0A0J7MMQ7_LASNI|nr:oxidoreductase domain-containing protein [Lasius niger]